MNKKYLFFDIDGTLTTHNPGGIIPQSTLNALDLLGKNGHFTAIATGRAQVLSTDFARQSHIDNIVSDGGNGITLNGKILDIKPLDRIKALAIIDEALEKKLPLSVSIDNTTNLYSRGNTEDHSLFYNLIVDPDFDFHKAENIFKIFLSLDEEEEKKLKGLYDLGYMKYHENSIIIEPDDKFSGIEKMMNLLNAPIEDVVVFGDGHNDLSMFQKAPMSIAMGNAIDELKEIATYVTTDSNEDGIFNACRYFGWIWYVESLLLINLKYISFEK